jgi:hypothetical protein
MESGTSQRPGKGKGTGRRRASHTYTHRETEKEREKEEIKGKRRKNELKSNAFLGVDAGLEENEGGRTRAEDGVEGWMKEEGSARAEAVNKSERAPALPEKHHDKERR